MRILIVEDDTTVTSFLTRRLGDDGHEVDHAADGREGLRLALANNHEI
jgi:two-component system OmpR family response regulator